MRKFFTFLFSVLLVTGVYAQRPEAVIKKADVKPVLDGEFDEVWATVDSQVIAKPFNGTVPTLGEEGETWWKALWDQDGFYLIINVADDAYYPNYVAGGGNAWEFDKPEVYFDVNFILEDALGPSAANSGHIQVAPDMTAAKENGELNTEDNGRQHAFKVANPTYVAEYYVPWSTLKTKDNAAPDLSMPMGFDITINDSDPDDPTRRRAVWANDGTITDEAWVNMDQCGIITLEGAEAGILPETVSITGAADITADGQTLQLGYTYTPDNVTDSTVVWSIVTAESTGRATISSTGLVTPLMDGTIKIHLETPDKYAYDDVTINISNQVVTKDKVNIVKNGNFDLFDETTMAPTNWGNWVDGETYGTVPVVTDGVAVLNSTGAHESENWHYQFNQTGLAGIADIPYIVEFKAWSDNDRDITFDFEDTSGNNYNRYGASSDETSNGGRSEWTFPISTEPTWYTFHVTFDQMVESTVQKIQFMLSQATGTVYLDSVSVISEADYALIPTAAKRQLSMETLDVYPNPAKDKLHVNLTNGNTKVVIYNSIGVVMEQAEVSGTHHMFDVSRYAPGMYFVKANNTVVKFMK